MGFPGSLPEWFLVAATFVAAVTEFLHYLCAFYQHCQPDAYAFGSHGFVFDVSEGVDSRMLPAPPECNDAEAILQSLPLSSFEMVTDTFSDGQCAVCLCEFAARQQILQLPDCRHIFHKDCIGSWVRCDQTTCPLCRRSLIAIQAAAQKLVEQLILERHGLGNSW